MQVRRFNQIVLASIAILASSAAVAAQPAPAPDAAPAAAPAPQPNSQFSVTQTVGDWVVRCAQVTVKKPAPCDMLQATVNQNSKQRVSSFSIAYVPSRDAYAMQIIVPTGVALSHGLILAAGNRSLNGAKFTRCERDGCYVELLSDQATMGALQNVGKTTSITVYGYGKNNEVKLPVSLTGFAEAMDRMKTFARDRAVALPTQSAPGAASAAPPAKAPAPARAARGARPTAPAPAPAAP